MVGRFTPRQAIEKLDHTLCLNSNEGNLKFGIDSYEKPGCDCEDLDEMIECIEIIEQMLNNYPELADQLITLRDISIESSNLITVCPVCGKKMNESYLGQQYCEDCAQKLK